MKFYEDPFFRFPKKQTDSDFIGFVERNYIEFNKRIGNAVREFPLLANEVDNLQVFCDKIIECLHLYYDVSFCKSYQKFIEAIDIVKDKMNYPKGKKAIVSNGKPDIGYRMRKSNEALLKSDDLFHTPFHERYKVGAYRYSIAGLPCLYFSNSIELCWYELRQPSLKKTYVSRIEFDKNDFNFLDLSFRPENTIMSNKVLIEKHPETDINLMLESVITWPLSFVCSIVVYEDKGAFKPEYIIPQLLMQWCREDNNIDGIYYFSTRPKYLNFYGYVPTHINVVIPVKSNGKSGYCENLKKNIKITSPLNAEKFKNAKKLTNEDWEKLIYYLPDSSLNSLMKSKKQNNYNPHPFLNMELTLCEMKADYIK